MKFRHITQEAGQALRTNMLRSSLTIIGIVVGIFAVTAMLSLGEGLSQNINDRISSFSSGDVSIQGTLSTQDLAWVQEQQYVEGAIGTLSIRSVDTLIFGEEYSVSVSSVLGDLEAVQQLDITEGEAYDFSDSEYSEKVVLVSSKLNDTVVEDTGTDLLDQNITIGGQLYKVVGIFEVDSAGFSRDDGTAYVPYRAAIGILTSASTFNSISVKLIDSSYFEIAGKHLLEGLNASRYLALDSEDVFSISTSQSIIESAQETTAMISLFLGVVGGIALFVGGIGTMNMMLTTVTERTKEIGLRKAIGARRSDILLQILVESVFLTMIGGAIGILLTVVLAVFANKALAGNDMLSVIVSSNVVILATVVSIAIGIVFGLYPANNASKLQPVDALRAE